MIDSCVFLPLRLHISVKNCIHRLPSTFLIILYNLFFFFFFKGNGLALPKFVFDVCVCIYNMYVISDVCIGIGFVDWLEKGFIYRYK